MPGLCGFVSSKSDSSALDLAPMLGTLNFARATYEEQYQENEVNLGCVHLGTGGQRAIYSSSQVVVVFYGYLTQPVIPPGTDKGSVDPAAAAHHIHDRYLEYGERIVDRLAGAFAFALWDCRTRTLLLVSDHLGLRPIYYAEYDGLFRFASEVKALLTDPKFPRRLDRAAIADLFHYECIMGDKTYFKDVHLLPPASVLRWQDGRWIVRAYWDIPYPDRYPRHPDGWYDRLIYDALQSAVKHMVRPELRYGLSLSGGLDSRWIAAFLGEIQPDTTMTFTLGSLRDDDSPIASRVATQTGLSNQRLDLSPTFVAEYAESIAYTTDGMYTLVCAEEFPLTTYVGDVVDISVGGFLGDPLFGHEMNPVYARLRRHDVMRYWLWKTKGARLPASVMARIFGDRAYRELEAMALDSLRERIAAAPSDRGFQVAHYLNIRQRQRRLINSAQVAKLSYVDIYHPFADNDVIQASLQLPPRQLMIERAYRRAMDTYYPSLAAIPWTFTLMPPTTSVSAIILKKVAQLTLGKWLRNTPFANASLIRPRRYYASYYTWTRKALRSFIEETLLSPEANATGLFDPSGLRDVVWDHMEGRIDATAFLGQALAVALWTRLFYVPSTPLGPNSTVAPITISG